jgi:hypothetical protein
VQGGVVNSMLHDFSRISVYPQAPLKPQTKLTVNTPGDIDEQEADRVAEDVIRAPGPQLLQPCTRSSANARVQINQPGREHDAPEMMRVRAGQVTAPPLVHEGLQSTGQHLDPETRRFMEPRFGHDFSKVRVYTGKEATESSSAMSAKAFTVGQNIVFGTGHYAPQTTEGRRLLAHELTHVVQQRAARPLARMSRGPVRNAHGSGVPGFMLQRTPIDPRSLETETKETPRHIRVSQWLVEPPPGGGTHREEVYWVDFQVDSKGVMRASVRTVLADRKYRSGLLRFSDRFGDALKYFQDNGVEVNEFEGDWSYMSPEEISDNLRVFREEMEEGGKRGTPEEAAKKTPSGKVAKSFGFELTSVENVPESQEHLAEQGVRRWRVKARFRRQSSGSESGPGVTPSGGKPKTGTTSEDERPVTRPRFQKQAENGDGPKFVPSALRFGASIAAESIIGLLTDYIIGKIQEHFSRSAFEQHLRELQPEIGKRKNEAIEQSPPEIRQLIEHPVLGESREFYWVIQLRIRTTQTFATNVRIPPSIIPEIVSVTVSEKESNNEGAVQKGKSVVAPITATYQREESQTVTYSEPIISWSVVYPADIGEYIEYYERSLESGGSRAEQTNVLHFTATERGSQ